MDFMQGLESRLAQYTSEADELHLRLERLDGLISHAKALLEEENRSTQMPLVIETPTLNGDQPPSNGLVGQPVSAGVYGMLQQGTTRYSDMVRRIPQEYPRIHVQHLAKGVGSTLKHGIKTGRIRRVNRGYYALK